MADWLEFEEQSTDYLNNRFGHLASFSHLGSSDATVPDIRVETKSGKQFYIDAKLTPAQCGQFVLLPNIANQCFMFSEKNKTKLTPQVQQIIDHMNADFEAYKEAGTAGKSIELNDGGALFAEWIVSTYRQKGTAFFITNGFTILPVSEFLNYFEVSAVYRVKRSGSRSVSAKSAPGVVQHMTGCGFPIKSHSIRDGKLFACSDVYLHNTRFIYKGSEYMFSQRGDEYEIRMLSNTFNANVIFSISKKARKGLSDQAFAACLV